MWRGVALVACLLLGGCSFSETIAENSINYNKTVAQSADAQILLNVLRARDRHPTHFTALTEFKGTLKQSTSGGFSFALPFGGGTNEEFSFNPQLNLTQESQPTYTITVLDTAKEFAKAVLTPVTLSDVKLFMDQGWPIEFLLYMAVESGEITGAKLVPKNSNDGTEEVPVDMTFAKLLGTDCRGIGQYVKNDPGNAKDSRCFRAIARYLAGDEQPTPQEDLVNNCSIERRPAPPGPRLRIVDTVSATVIAPDLPKTDLNDVKKIAEVRKLGFAFIEVGKNYRLCEVSKETRFCILGVQDCESDKTEAELCQSASDTAQRQAQSGVDKSGLESMSLRVPLICRDQKAQDWTLSFTFSAQLRSLQGMLYYAGELVRDKESQFYVSRKKIDPKDITFCGADTAPAQSVAQTNPTGKPLLKIESGPAPSDAAVAVVHQGKPYWIRSGEKCSESLSVLALLTQIQALYQSRTEIPTSQTILSID